MADVAFPPERRGPHSGEQSGDLQGLPRNEAADSESVDELIEVGNAFEANVVSGIETAGEADGKEVRTHEVPEDDVPGEYLDKRVGRFNFLAIRREAAQFLLLFVTIFGYDEAFLGCCGLRRTSSNFAAECF